MSYTQSADLQKAVYDALTGNAGLMAMVAGVFDAPPAGTGAPPTGTYITIGEEVMRDNSSASHHGVIVDFEVVIHSDYAGFGVAKEVAGLVEQTLSWNDIPMAQGSLDLLFFLKSRARRGVAPETRRIVLVFRAFLNDATI